MEPNIFWGNILRTQRIKHNLTQKELAAVLNVTRQAYSNYETGRNQPSPELIAILSDIYEIDLFSYVLQYLPDDYVAEEQVFKFNLQTAAKTKTRQKRVNFRQDIPGDPNRELWKNFEPEPPISVQDSSKPRATSKSTKKKSTGKRKQKTDPPSSES